MKTLLSVLCLSIAGAGIISLSGCDDSKAKSKTTTTKTQELPNGDVKKTTETTEKKVEENHK